MKKTHFRLWLHGAVLLGIAAFLLLICVIEPRKLQIRAADLPLDSWPAEMNGFSVAVVTDPHFSCGETERMRKIHRAVASLHPDIIVLLGDYLRSSQQPSEIPPEEELRFFFRGFSAPCGVYAVYGNHEVFHHKKRLAEVARSVGVRWLCNESVTLSAPGGKFLLSGLDDATTSDYRLPEKSQEDPLPEILLSHNPQGALAFPERKIALTLAGHTHGGQACWPWGGTVYPFHRWATWFPSGLCEVDGEKVFLGNGLGSGRFTARWNCPPEIVFLRLFSSGSVPEVPASHPAICP